MKYTKFDFEYGTLDEDLETYDYIRLPYESLGKTKVLFVLDHVPSEDLKSGRLLSGVTGDLLNSLVRATKKLHNVQPVSFSWLACCANAFRTYGKSAEFRAQAEVEFKKRLTHIILNYRPDYIVAFGQTSMRILLGDKLVQAESGKLKYSYWLGVPVEREFKKGSKSHKSKVVSNISLNDIVQGDSGEAGLLGYMCKCLAPVFGRGYFVDASNIMRKGCTVVDTVEKFDKLLDYMAKQKAVAIDTEAKNLHKITNQLFTVQMACNSEKAYLIPVSHKDSPFTQKEIKHICTRLQQFLEGENENEYHIYTNAKFDLTLFRSSCNVRYFKNAVWDILGGEFCFHPDTLVLTELGWIRIQELVQMMAPPKVASFNHSTYAVEFSEVLLQSEHATDEDMYELEYDGGTIQVTGNHKVWSVTRQAYVRVDEICLDEEILVLDGPDS